MLISFLANRHYLNIIEVESVCPFVSMSYWHQIFFIRCCADLCIVPRLHVLFYHPVNNHHTTLGLPSMDGILVLSYNAQSNVVLVHVAPARPCRVLSFSWYLNEVSSLTSHQLWCIFSTCGDQPTWEVFISFVIPLNFLRNVHGWKE